MTIKAPNLGPAPVRLPNLWWISRGKPCTRGAASGKGCLCVSVPQFASCVRVCHVKYVWVVKYICQLDTERCAAAAPICLHVHRGVMMRRCVCRCACQGCAGEVWRHLDALDGKSNAPRLPPPSPRLPVRVRSSTFPWRVPKRPAWHLGAALQNTPISARHLSRIES